MWKNSLLFIISLAFFISPNAQAKEGNAPWSEEPISRAELFEMASEERWELAKQYGLFDEEEMIPMRDGTKLYTKIHYIPLKPERPVIVVRTPYDMEFLEELVPLVTLSGYHLVTQYTRGRFNSEGEDRVFQTDGWSDLQDGYDTIEWVGRRSWCDGNIGTWGYSALGITSSFASAASPPSLKCQVIGFAPSNGFHQSAYQGGALRESLLNNWLISNDSGHMLPIFKEHRTEDEFWNQYYNVELRYPDINTPALFIGGWYDCFQQGTFHDFMGRNNQGSSQAQGNQKLIMGPWSHTNQTKKQQGQLTFPSNSLYEDEFQETLRWFDYWLKDKSNGIDSEPAVTYYVMGDTTNSDSPGNEWRTAETWPPEHESTPLFLHSGERLSQSQPNHSTSREMILNPENPSPTLGGMNLEIDSGPHDQNALNSRKDVLVYTTEVLEEAIEVTGKIKAIIYASSDVSDTDITVRLADVYPDGKSMLVCDGILRASYHESFSNPSPITPGEIYRFEVDLWNTSLIFDQGHQIRIYVSNTNHPRFELNPVYDTLSSGETSRTTIYHSPEYPSHVLLPVVSGDLPTKINKWKAYE